MPSDLAARESAGGIVDGKTLESRRFPPVRSKARLGSALLRVAAFSLLFIPGGINHAEEHRKLKSGPPPEYPELARKTHIQGIARVELIVLPDGSVGKVKELGGNPVLLDALVHAVRKWRYESADRESVVEVQFEFKSS